MNIEEFEDWLDRLGDDLSKWPGPQQAAARTLLAESPAARTLMNEAEALSRMLRSPSVRAPTGLADRIVMQAKSTPAQRSVEKPSVLARLLGFMAVVYRPSLAVFLPICFILGILVGFFHTAEELYSDELDLTSYLMQVVDTAAVPD
jgi:hypothetical protein